MNRALRRDKGDRLTPSGLKMLLSVPKTHFDIPQGVRRRGGGGKSVMGVDFCCTSAKMPHGGLVCFFGLKNLSY